MKLEEIILSYISPIRKFEDLGKDFTGKDLYNHFRKQAEFEDIEAFTKPRFESRIKDYLESQEQHDFLLEKSKEITKLSQAMFLAKFPNYYREDPTAKFRKSFQK